mgnify:FL=1
MLQCDACGLRLLTVHPPENVRCVCAHQAVFSSEHLLLRPGWQLHRLIEKLTGNLPERGCGCRDRITKMNAWGVDGCREHLDEITDWLVKQAEKHGWKLRVPGIGSLARLAPEGVQRWTCRQLVLLAIRRTEKDAQRQRA